MVRFKNRYITVVIDNLKSTAHPLNFTSQELYNEIINKINYLHGSFGSTAVKQGLKVNYCNDLTRIAILRVRHGPHKLIISVLPFVNKIKYTDCTLNLLYVGATLLHCYKAILSYQRVELNKFYPNLKLEEELKQKAILEDLIKHCKNTKEN